MSAPVPVLALPVGHLQGSGPGGALVRVGPEQVELDDARFTVWSLAHGLPDRPAAEPWTPEALLATAAAQGLGDLRTTLDDLVADRLVRLVDPGAGRAFAEQHRLVPLVLGLGNDPEDVGTWSLGLLGEPLVQVTGTTLDLFQYADLEHHLWGAVQNVARVAHGSGWTDPAATDPDRLLADVLGTLHVLLSVGAVCLDTRYVTA